MAFTPFIDDLGLIEVLILLAACVLTYVGLCGWWAMIHGDPKGVRAALRGGAIPVGIVGATGLIIGLWGEMVWPFPAASMGGYDIFFLDVLVLFGIVMVAYAVTMLYNLRLQYLGILAMVAGFVTIFYGYTADVWLTGKLAFTKDPFDTWLLYLGFGVAGIAAFPAAVIVDLYLAAAEGTSTFWTSVVNSTTGYRSSLNSGMGTRGVGAVVGDKPSASVTETVVVPAIKYRIPIILQLVLLAFPLFMALAGIAALGYFDTTLSGHLAGGPSAAP